MTGVVPLVVLAIALAVAAALVPGWAWLPALGAVVALCGAVWAWRWAERNRRSWGYVETDEELLITSGVWFRRLVAVPYGRMQLVDITHGPLDRGFGIAQHKLVTAAATTGVTIPGLRQEAAERLRDTLVDVAETRRTGL